MLTIVCSHCGQVEQYVKALRPVVSEPVSAVEPVPQPAFIPSNAVPAFELTEREKVIAQCVATGFKNKEIADSLHISVQTVKNHLHKIFTKTGCKDRLEVALWMIDRNGLK